MAGPKIRSQWLFQLECKLSLGRALEVKGLNYATNTFKVFSQLHVMMIFPDFHSMIKTLKSNVVDEEHNSLIYGVTF